MDENFVLTKEILGPIIRDSYWYDASKPPWDPDPNWGRVAQLTMDKIVEVREHKKHHNCSDTKGNTADHFMYLGCLITKNPGSEKWNGYGISNRWLILGDRQVVVSHIENIHAPKGRIESES